MRERERLLWSILIILLLIIAGYEGYNAYRMGRQVRKYQEALTHEGLGSEDPQLKETVMAMETELQERLTYQFSITHDPLDLTQVIYAQRLLASLGYSETMESRNKMRLSCTVMAEKPAAVIKFQGRSNIVRLGDTISGYRLSQISAQQVILVRGGERIVLTTERSPESMGEMRRLMARETLSTSASDTLKEPINF